MQYDQQQLAGYAQPAPMMYLPQAQSMVAMPSQYGMGLQSAPSMIAMPQQGALGAFPEMSPSPTPLPQVGITSDSTPAPATNTTTEQPAGKRPPKEGASLSQKK